MPTSKRPLLLLYLLSILHLHLPTTLAAPRDDSGSPFDCHVTVGLLTYDLTALAGEHKLTRTRETPPTSMEDTVRFDLCTDLAMQEGVVEGEQCPSGTRACLTKVNKKPDTADRVIAVIPLAQTASLQPEYSALSSPKGLSLILHGASYPHPRTTLPTPQSLNVSLLCSTESSDPKLIDYDGSQMRIEWSAPSACSFQGDRPPEDSKEGEGEKSKERVGSGVGFFFVVLFLALAAYFGLGAYYNYTTYGATGFDLVPHRDFWREVPYMLQDVISHLCANVRPRHSSRGGYIAV